MHEGNAHLSCRSRGFSTFSVFIVVVVIVYCCFLDCSPLYYAIHEKRTDHLSDIRPHLWVYRPRITIETLFQKLLQCAYEFPVLKYLAKHVRINNDHSSIIIVVVIHIRIK